jgi:hypothetical protein
MRCGVSYPELSRSWWLAFSLDHDEGDACRLFLARFGVLPELVLRSHNLLWIGPIPSPTA